MEQQDVGQAGVRCRPIIFKLHEDAVLQVLRLKESLPVDWTIVKPWEAQIPHQVATVFARKEVLIEVLREVQQN